MNSSQQDSSSDVSHHPEFAAETSRQSTSPPSAADRRLQSMLTKHFDDSQIRMILWNEPRPEQTDEVVTVQFTDRKALWQILRNPGLHFGDLYSAGRIRVYGDLLKLIDEGYRYIAENKPVPDWLTRLSRLTGTPSLSDSRRNIHHHYDIGNEFYELWLDRAALQYTCAYYPEKDLTLEQAQQAKMHQVCRKLQLQAGQTVVEAGSGWGGFALFMAKNYDVNVRSFNISRQQVAFARDWVKRENLAHRVEFVEDDFRNISGRYDAFVSIGMLEHVGPGNYRDMGKLIGRVLSPEGRGLIHTIGRDKPERLNPWINKRIFPGAYPPTLGEMMDIFEPNGLSVLDVENIRLHYAETLKGWLERFEENTDKVEALFDEEFVRSWRMYLVGSITAFLRGKLQLFQLVFTRSGMNSIPWTREHMYPGSE